MLYFPQPSNGACVAMPDTGCYPADDANQYALSSDQLFDWVLRTQKEQPKLSVSQVDMALLLVLRLMSPHGLTLM